MSSASVLWLFVCQSNRLLSHNYDIVDCRYILTLRKADALRSLTALVAEITMISFNTVHTSDIAPRWAGESDMMNVLTAVNVGFSAAGMKAVVKLSS